MKNLNEFLIEMFQKAPVTEKAFVTYIKKALRDNAHMITEELKKELNG